MKACILGCGQVCDIHSGELDVFFDELVFVDKNIQMAESQCRGRKRAKAFTEIPKKDFDIGLVLTPNHLHLQHALDFINRDIPVFLEKPPVLNRTELDKLESTIQKTGAWLTVGYQVRFSPAIQAIKQELKNKRIIHIDCWKHRAVSTGYYEDGWHGTEMDGGVLMQQGAHCVDLVSYLSNDECPKNVYKVTKNARHHIYGGDSGSMFIEYPNHTASINCTTAPLCAGRSGLVITYEDGVLECGGFAWERLLETRTYGYLNLNRENKDKSAGYCMWYVIKHCIENKLPPPVPLSSAGISIKLLNWRN